LCEAVEGFYGVDKWEGSGNLSRVAHKNWWEIFFLIEADCGAFLIVGIYLAIIKAVSSQSDPHVVVFHETCLVGLDKVGTAEERSW